jgi:hypothetical protein
MLPNDIIEKILLLMPLHPGSPFGYSRVSKAWYKIIKSIHFWQRFMNNVFQDKELLTCIADLPKIWKNFMNNSSDSFPHFLKNIFIEPDDAVFKKAVDVSIVYQRKNKQMFLMNRYLIFESGQTTVYLDIVPIRVQVNNTGFLTMSIPRIKNTENFFKYMVDIEDKFEILFQEKGEKFQRRIKDNERKWLNISLNPRDTIGIRTFNKILLNKNFHPIINYIPLFSNEDFANAYPNITTLHFNAIVTFSFSHMWSSNHTHGIVINNLMVYTFPLDQPRIFKKSEPDQSVPIRFPCKCKECESNRYWAKHALKKNVDISSQNYDHYFEDTLIV